MSKGNKAVKAAGFMMLITLIGKVMGLMREQFLASSFALGMEASAFMTASQIPRIFFDTIFASAISASFIPIFNEYMEKKGKKEAFRLSNNFITIILLLTTLMSVAGVMFAPWLTELFADGFNEETAALCTQLLVYLMPTIIFTGIAFSFVGILQSMDEFGIPAAMSIASNGVVIIYFLFFNKYFGVMGLTVAFLIGWAMQAIIQVPPLLKRGYIFKPYLDLKDDGIKRIFMLMLPVMVSTWIQPINLSINIKFASRLFDGSGAGISAINYANTLYTIIIGVFVLSIANVIFPELSRLSINDKKDEFGEMVKKTLRILIFIVIPMMLGLMALSQPIIKLIYQYGKFDAASSAITSKALFFFSLGMVGFGVQTVLSRVCYALKDGRTPLISGVISILVNIALCSLLIDKFEVTGLAIASAVSTTVAGIALLVPMQMKMKNLTDKHMFIDFIKAAVAGIIMFVLVVLMKNFISTAVTDGVIGRILIVGVPTVIGVIVYMIITYLMGIEESRYVLGFANKFLKRS